MGKTLSEIFGFGSQKVEFSQDFGFKLLKKGKLHEAEVYFQRFLDKNPFAHYGLGTVWMSTLSQNFDIKRALDVASLYEDAIHLKPDFSDAFLMEGMALILVAEYYLVKLEKDSIHPQSDEFLATENFLMKSQDYLRKAAEINREFEHLLEEQQPRLDEAFRRLSKLRSSKSENQEKTRTERD